MDEHLAAVDSDVGLKIRGRFAPTVALLTSTLAGYLSRKGGELPAA